MTSIPLTRKFHLVAGAAILSALASPTVAEAGPATIKGRCVALKQAFAASSRVQWTSSNLYTNLVGATLKPHVTQGCLVVDFAAEIQAQTLLFVKVLLDGTPMAPGPVTMASDDTNDPPDSYGFSFVATGLASGPHSVQVQFATNDTSMKAYIYRYTLVAHYD
jgi:hypothetical protein